MPRVVRFSLFDRMRSAKQEERSAGSHSFWSVTKKYIRAEGACVHLARKYAHKLKMPMTYWDYGKMFMFYSRV